MSLTTYQTDELKKALDTIYPAVARTSPMQILTHVHLMMGSIAATNLELEMKAPVAGQGDPINVCIPADRLKLAVSAGSREIKIDSSEASKGFITIRAGRSRFRVPVLDGLDMPSIDVGKELVKFQTDDEFGEKLGRVIFSAAKKDLRYYLMGVFLDSTPSEGLVAVATDGHRAARSDLGVTCDTFQFIVPVAVCDVLSKLPAAEWAICEGSKATITCDNVSVTTKAVDGRYPDWRRVLKPVGADRITLSRKELIDATALTRHMRDAANKVRAMQLSSDDGQTLFTKTTLDGNVVETELPIISMTAPSFCTALNGDYLDGALRAMADDEVTLVYDHKNPNTAPIYTETDGFAAVLMPMRI